MGTATRDFAGRTAAGPTHHDQRVCSLPRAEAKWSGGVVSGADRADEWIEFTVLHCTKGLPEIRNADFLGPVPMVDGSAIVVLGRYRPGEDGSFTMTVPDADEVRRKVRDAGTVGALIQGKHADGCLWFLDLHMTPPEG